MRSIGNLQLHGGSSELRMTAHRSTDVRGVKVLETVVKGRRIAARAHTHVCGRSVSMQSVVAEGGCRKAWAGDRWSVECPT